MAEKKPQTLTNHAKLVPGYHFVLAALLLIIFLGSAWLVFKLRDAQSVIDLLIAVALLMTFWYVRIFPLKAQDRVIRLEERLRCERLLPGEVRGRIEELTPRQMIALRFASDGELPELVRAVLDEKIADQKTIKKRIKNWRPDYFRL